MKEEKNLNINYILNELKKYRQLSAIQEEEIKKNKDNISILINSNNEMKNLLSQFDIEKNGLKKEIDNLLKKNEELSEKNYLLEEELNNINMQHKNELDSLRNRTDLFMNNNSIVNNQIELNLKLKNAEIDSLKNEVILLKEEKNKLELDLENIRKNFNAELIKRQKQNEKIEEKNLEMLEQGKDEINETYKNKQTFRVF